ncbi:proton-coupled zinc antiporter SLC30A9, mitochondrial-like [Oscarella lobularis]|uniref:proton-coupled zinc antiporter SLC30A9, mitochondrial-like n=1 Tax=Oscarella lobularis TaxID=121494 RepID=UPI0033136D42
MAFLAYEPILAFRSSLTPRNVYRLVSLHDRVVSARCSDAIALLRQNATNQRRFFSATTKDDLRSGDSSQRTKRSAKTHFYRGNTYISSARAQNDYLLGVGDLEDLRKYSVRSAYEEEGILDKMYRLSDVQARSLLVWGSQEALNRELERRKFDMEEDERRRKQLSALIGHLKKSVKDQSKKEVHLEVFGHEKERLSFFSGSAKIVTYAILSNAAVTMFKLAAWLYSGSSSMLAEAIHSFVDMLNQGLLAIGIANSIRKPDPDHPYGFSRVQYVYALVSGVGIFFLGAGASLYHGIHGLWHPPHLQSLQLALVVLGGSAIVEIGTLLAAIVQVRASAHSAGMTFREYVRFGRDPSAVAVLLEDSAAVVGVAIAGLCLSLATYQGHIVYDSIGSICIGSLLGCVAAFLIRRNMDFLVGRTIDSAKLRRIIEILENDVMVRSVHDVKAVDLGANTIRFKAEIDFDGREVARSHVSKLNLDSILAEVQTFTTVAEMEHFLLNHGERVIDVLGLEVDRIERNIKKSNPECRHVDLEIL